MLGPDHVDGQVQQVADHRLDIPPVIPDLGVLRRLDLDERGIDESREATGDLGLAHPGGADHDDVLGGDFTGGLRREPTQSPAITHRHRHCLLGRILADDIAIKFSNNLARCEFIHGCVW